MDEIGNDLFCPGDEAILTRIKGGYHHGERCISFDMERPNDGGNRMGAIGITVIGSHACGERLRDDVRCGLNTRAPCGGAI